MEKQKRNNPWLGLESYREGEVLYGRDEDIRDLTQSVLNDRDTLLYGKSGIGKSSILNAGIIPAARRHGYLPVLIRFSHKEQNTYLYQIKNAIANAMIPIPVDEIGNQIALSPEQQKIRESKLALRIKEVVECKNSEKESIYEYLHRYTFHADEGERIKLLIIFDQFEEIFTLQSNEVKKKNFFSELADFLNDIMPSELQQEVINPHDTQEEVSIVDGANLDDLFKDLDLGINNDAPEYVTDNDIHLVFTIREDFLSEFEYYSASIPSLKQNRYGLRPINEEQAAQIILRPMPGLINEDVAKLIIEKVTGRMDFELDGIPEIEVDSAVLSLYLNRLYDAKNGDKITSELVEQKGGEIIADFYKDAISSISESTIEYLEDMLLNGQGRRDNITVFDAVNDGGATEEELDILCNKKKVLRQFNYAGDLRIEYVHDILCPVVKVHKEERLLLKQQEEDRIRQEEEKQKFLLEEKAKREEIEREAEEEKTRLRAETIRIRKRNRHRLYAIGSFLLLLLVGATIYWLLCEKEYETNYATFTTQDGWPIGIGKELNGNDKKKMPVYYQLIRKGYSSKNKNTRVKVMNSCNKLTQNKFNESPAVGLYETEGSDEKAKEFAMLQRQTAYWIYTPDNEGNLLRKTAYGIDDNVLYAVQYFRSTAVSDNESAEDSEKKQLWANYVDKDGKAMRIRDNGVDRVRIIVDDSTKYYIGYQFYSETGTPQPNNLDVYGYRYIIRKDDGRIIQKTPVDAFGDLLDTEATLYKDFDEYGRWTEIEGGQAEYSNQLVVFSLKNRRDSLKFSTEGELLYHSEMKNNGELKMFYYGKGQVVKTFHYRKTNTGIELAYSRQVLPTKNSNIKETQIYWADSTIQYRIKREENNSRQMTIAYYGGNTPSSINKPLLIPEEQYHKLISDTTMENGYIKVTKTFFDENGNLSPLRKYNRDIAYYNNNREMLKHIVYKDKECIYAYLYEYEDGQIISQSVLDINDTDTTIIRYPEWDRYHLCYYKMKLVYNFSNTLVAVKGINEFGEESLITTPAAENYIVNIVPSLEMSTTVGDDDLYGIQIYKVQAPLVDKKWQVEYIHILDKTGTWYQAGIRNGDLLVNDGNPITIAHPVPSQNTYQIRTLSIIAGSSGAEHYPVYFTEKEMKRYTNEINKRR